MALLYTVSHSLHLNFVNWLNLNPIKENKMANLALLKFDVQEEKIGISREFSMRNRVRYFKAPL